MCKHYKREIATLFIPPPPPMSIATVEVCSLSRKSDFRWATCEHRGTTPPSTGTSVLHEECGSWWVPVCKYHNCRSTFSGEYYSLKCDSCKRHSQRCRQKVCLWPSYNSNINGKGMREKIMGEKAFFKWWDNIASSWFLRVFCTYVLFVFLGKMTL